MLEENQTPLNATELSPIIVLNDGETFSDARGTGIAFVNPEWETEEIEEALEDESVKMYDIGPHAKAPATAAEAVELMLTLCPWMQAEYDNSGQLMFYSNIYDESKAETDDDDDE